MNFLEVRRAVGEMVMTAKTSEEKKHYEAISRMNETELKEEATAYLEAQQEKNAGT